MSRTLVIAVALTIVCAGCAVRAPVPENPDVLLVHGTPAPMEDPLILDRLAAYYDEELETASRDELRKRLEAEGTLSGEEIKAALEASGFFVVAFRGEVDPDSPRAATHHLDQGRPLLVFLDDPEDASWWTLLVGYDDPTTAYILMEASGALAVMNMERLHELWAAGNHVTILALPEGLVNADTE